MSAQGKSHSMATLFAEVGMVLRNRIGHNNDLVIKQHRTKIIEERTHSPASNANKRY